MTDHVTDPPPDPHAIATVTAAITIDGTRYSHTEGVSAYSWTTAGDHFRDMVRAQARSRLGQHLADQLPITLTEAEECFPGHRTESAHV